MLVNHWSIDYRGDLPPPLRNPSIRVRSRDTLPDHSPDHAQSDVGPQMYSIRSCRASSPKNGANLRRKKKGKGKRTNQNRATQRRRTSSARDCCARLIRNPQNRDSVLLLEWHLHTYVHVLLCTYLPYSRHPGAVRRAKKKLAESLQQTSRSAGRPTHRDRDRERETVVRYHG